MASPVRISDKLIGEVAGNISDMYRWFIDEVEKQKPDVGDRIYELLYGPYLSRMEQLPVSFFRRLDRVEVRSIDGKTFGYSFKLSSLKLGSYTHPPGDNVECAETFIDKVNIKRTPYTEDIIEAILSWDKQKQDLFEARTQATQATKRLLRNNKSLAPAIKAYPPLVDLLSPETRKKIDVPQHRLTSALMELDPDLKRLASDIALKKLLNR